MSLGPDAGPHRVAGEHVVLVVAAALDQAGGELERHRGVVGPLPPLPQGRSAPCRAARRRSGRGSGRGAATPERAPSASPTASPSSAPRARSISSSERPRPSRRRTWQPGHQYSRRRCSPTGRDCDRAAAALGTAGRPAGRSCGGSRPRSSTPARSSRRETAASRSSVRSESADTGANGSTRLAVQRLAPNDVADAGQHALVEQHLGHRPVDQARAAQILARVEAAVQQVGPEPRRPSAAADAQRVPTSTASPALVSHHRAVEPAAAGRRRAAAAARGRACRGAHRRCGRRRRGSAGACRAPRPRSHGAPASGPSSTSLRRRAGQAGGRPARASDPQAPTAMVGS